MEIELQKQLKTLAEKRAKYTTQEKEYIVSLCAEHGVHINTLCPSCYKDAVIELYSILKPKEKSVEVQGYRLKAGVNVLLYARNGNTYRINESALTAANAKEWIAAGARDLFEKVPDED